MRTSTSNPKDRSFVRGLPSFLSVAAILLLWKYAAAKVGAEIILPDPEKTAAVFLQLLSEGDFWRSVAVSAYRVLAGFLLSAAAGMVVGIPAGMRTSVRAAFDPLLALIRSTPIMSIILIALLWFKTGTVPIFSAFLIGFPVIVRNIIEGIGQTDTKLIEMGRAYRIGPQRMLTAVYIPSVVPYLISGAQTALGLTWKVVVAAEVLSLPKRGIGAKMQYAQMSLETAEVFAWTAAAILCAALSHGILARILRFFPWRERHAA